MKVEIESNRSVKRIEIIAGSSESFNAPKFTTAVELVASAPLIFVLFRAAQKMKFPHARLAAFADDVTEEEHSGALEREVRIEAAEVCVVAAAASRQTDPVGGRAEPEPQDCLEGLLELAIERIDEDVGRDDVGKGVGADRPAAR